MRHRIFLAINIREDIKKKLYSQKIRLSEIPCRWTKQDNLHITLLFVGYLSDEELVDTCRIAKKIASENVPFYLNLTNIAYGPIGKLPPRMIWAYGDKSKKLGKLKLDLEKKLSNSNIKYDKNGISPHITLARIKAMNWKQTDQEELPNVNGDISLQILVNSIEIMESVMKKTGSEYEIIESYELSG